MFHVVRLKQKLTFVPTLLCAYRYNDGGSQNDNYQQQADTAKVHEPTNGGKHEIVLVVDNNNEPLGDSFQLRRPLCDCDVDFALPLQRENAPMHQTDYLETRQPIRVDILCKGAGPNFLALCIQNRICALQACEECLWCSAGQCSFRYIQTQISISYVCVSAVEGGRIRIGGREIHAEGHRTLKSLAAPGLGVLQQAHPEVKTGHSKEEESRNRASYRQST